MSHCIRSKRRQKTTRVEILVESCWNVMTHRDAQEGKWRGNWRMEWVASTLHTTSEHGVSSITTADEHASAASSRLNWHPRPADLNGLVRCAERRNVVSACVPSHFKSSLMIMMKLLVFCEVIACLLEIFKCFSKGLVFMRSLLGH